MKREMDSSTKIAGNFATPLSIMARSPRQKINKTTADLSDTRTNGPHRPIQNTPSHNNRIRILLKLTWNILQEGSSIRLQNKS